MSINRNVNRSSNPSRDSAFDAVRQQAIDTDMDENLDGYEADLEAGSDLESDSASEDPDMRQAAPTVQTVEVQCDICLAFDEQFAQVRQLHSADYLIDSAHWMDLQRRLVEHLHDHALDEALSSQLRDFGIGNPKGFQRWGVAAVPVQEVSHDGPTTSEQPEEDVVEALFDYEEYARDGLAEDMEDLQYADQDSAGHPIEL